MESYDLCRMMPAFYGSQKQLSIIPLLDLDFLLWLEIKSFTRAAYIGKRLHGIAEIKD